MSSINIEKSVEQTAPVTPNLLAALWRSEGMTHFLATRSSQSQKFQHTPIVHSAQLKAAVDFYDGKGFDCYHACAEFSSNESRTADNAAGARAHWIDVDCGAEKAANGKGYATQAEALAALKAFCAKLNLPEPNWIINSGSGLHCYWVQDQFVEKAAWKATADQLKALFHREGFLADPSRTADIASILRVPGTLNRKGQTPLPVTVLRHRDEYLSRDDFCAAVAREYTRGIVVPTTGAQAALAPARTAIQYDKPTLDQLRSALKHLDPDCDEKTWKFYRIAPLVHLAKAYSDDANAYKELAKEWSRGGLWNAPSKFWHAIPEPGKRTAEQEFEATWSRFLAAPNSDRQVTVGTIFKQALDLGWSYDRRTASEHSSNAPVPKTEGQTSAPPVTTPPPSQSSASSQIPAGEAEKPNSGSTKKGDGAGVRAYKEHAPWPDPIVPAELLSEISRTIRRYVIITPEQADAAALWVAHTHFIPVLDISPLAMIDAPERACAKSLMLEIMEALSQRALLAANASVSAIFRAIEEWRSSLFIDEADTFFKDNKELHGVVNAGYKRGGVVLRAESVGDRYEPKAFSVFGPKALAGIQLSRHLPDSTMSRGIVWAMRRKMSSETVERMRWATASKDFDTLASKLARFSQDCSEKVRDARPHLPQELSDRAIDNWEPLLMIAECAGREWVQRAEAAAIALSAAVEVQGSASNDLLTDIREVLTDWTSETIKTVDLIDQLCKDHDMGWNTYYRGQKISARQLAKYLAAYGLAPRTVRQRDGSTPKGYVLIELQAVFARYLKPIENEDDAPAAVAATPPQPLGMPPVPGGAVADTSDEADVEDDDLPTAF